MDTLAPDEIVTRQGMRITAPLRTILDVADWGTAPEQVIMAVEQAHARGAISAVRLRQAATRRDRRVQLQRSRRQPYHDRPRPMLPSSTNR